MKRILVLPGTIWQVPLMREIKAMGYELHLVNPTKNEGVYEIADHFYQSDIFAYEDIINYCNENAIDAVMSEECDIATDAIAKYNKAIGARCLSADMAELFTNKYKMREFCKKNNFNPIPHTLCENIQEAYAFFKTNGKSIMKPLDSNASHGVFTIEFLSDIDRYFEETIKYSRNFKAVLLEKFIEGTEFTVDGIMTINGHKTLAISEKDHYKHNNNIANSLYFTQKNPNFDYTLLRKTNDELLNATKLPYGITHVEYKFCDGKFYLIEMAARGGGNLISAIIAPFMSGVDNYYHLISSCIDKKHIVDVVPNIDNNKTAILKFLDLPGLGGYVKKIEGLDYLESEPCIKSYHLSFKVGDYVKQPESDSVRVGYYIVCAESKDEFDKVINNINEKLKIVLE